MTAMGEIKRTHRRQPAALLLMLLATVAARAQEPLTLQRAVGNVLAGNPLRHVAAADVKISESDHKAARAVFFPRVSFDETLTRSNDPVYVFGTKLRQQRFTALDFALPRLNTPSAIANYQARFGGEWQVFDSLQSWNRVQGARRMVASAQQRLSRSDQELVFRTVDAYLGVLRAQREMAVAQQAEKTAEAMLARVRDRYGQGLVVQADLLSTQVNHAQRRQQTIRARNELSVARSALNLMMARPADDELVLEDEVVVPPQPAPLQDIETQALAERPDLRAAALESEAQDHNVRAAKGALGPRISLFGAWESDTAAFVSNGGNNWLGGVQVHLDLFTGGARRAELEKQRARLNQATAGRMALQDRARLEVRRAYYDLQANLEQVEVARIAIAQADESLRIQQNRYDNGLSPLTDLLRVEEDTRRTQSDYWQTLYRAALSRAALQLAAGTLSPDSPVVKP